MDRVMNIAVLLGGTSAEREVSLRSGAACAEAIRQLGHKVTEIDAATDLCRGLSELRPDLVFIALHGGVGEDGSVQGMLEVMGVPYTGSGVMASAVAMDKVASKRLFEGAGLKVPPYEIVTSLEHKTALEYPVVVKPSREGSSVGVSIVKDASGLRAALKDALSYHGPALMERYIKGKEIQIGVLGSRVLGGVEVRPKAEFYSYEAKYTAGMTEYILPPELDEKTYERAKQAGLLAHEALGCSGASRVDLIIAEDGAIYGLEVNTIPGMTATSLLPKIAGLSGYGFKELIAEIIKDAMEGRK